MPDHKHSRPSNTRQTGDRLKLHRRQVRAGGRIHTVVTLRPGTRARFSTNFYHGTWHILSDPHGALLLARLLWGLSFQRQPDTVVLIDRRFIDPNPFDAEPGDPIVVIPADLTHLPARTAHRLTRQVGPSAGTVRWHTWGLDAAVEAYRADTRRREGHREDGTLVDRLNGLLILRASSGLLRRWAVGVATMADYSHDGMSYVELPGPKWELCRSDGEVQTFRDYRHRVSTAKISREEVLAADNAPTTPADLQPVIWRRNAVVESRRRAVGSTGPTADAVR